MVLADAESEITRERSRGLSGGSFLLSTLLNRKAARTKKGKEDVEALKDYFLLKSDATFCHYTLHKYELDENVDNTPIKIRQGSRDAKQKYLHNLVAEALKDLLPYFKEAKHNIATIPDFPLQEGRKVDHNSKQKTANNLKGNSW